MGPRPTTGKLGCHVDPWSSEMAMMDKLNPSEYKGKTIRFSPISKGLIRVIQPKFRFIGSSAAALIISSYLGA